jgi:hypothetical protein
MCMSFVQFSGRKLGIGGEPITIHPTGLMARRPSPNCVFWNIPGNDARISYIASDIPDIAPAPRAPPLPAISQRQGCRTRRPDRARGIGQESGPGRAGYSPSRKILDHSLEGAEWVANGARSEGGAPKDRAPSFGARSCSGSGVPGALRSAEHRRAERAPKDGAHGVLEERSGSAPQGLASPGNHSVLVGKTNRKRIGFTAGAQTGRRNWQNRENLSC